MRLVNPLHTPLAILAGAGTLLGGVLVVHQDALPMTLAGLVVSFGVASLLDAVRTRPRPTHQAPTVVLEPALQSVLVQAEGLAARAERLKQEAHQRLTDSTQLELLGAILYACERAGELPAQLRPVLISLQSGGEAVFSPKELRVQLRDAEAKAAASQGPTRDQALRLVERLRQNLALVEQGASTREARLTELDTAVAEAAGVLLSLQTRLREGSLKTSEEAQELQALTEDFRIVQKSVQSLVGQTSVHASAGPTKT